MQAAPFLLVQRFRVPRYSRAMLTILLAAAAAASAPAAPADLSRLTADHKAALRCAAVFAVVAAEQDRGSKAALELPPLVWRGREYFVRTSTRVMAEAHLSREAVRGLLEANVADMQREATKVGDPDAELAVAVRPCAERLEKTVPPLATPTLLQCSGLFTIAADEIHKAEGMTDRAKDMLTLAYVLKSRAREAQVAAGKSGTEADIMVAEAHTAMVAETAPDSTSGGADRYDLDHCYNLAKPDGKKSHY